MQAHPDFEAKYANNKDVQNKEPALRKIMEDVMAKERKKELELYRGFAKDESFYQAFFQTMKRMMDSSGMFGQVVDYVKILIIAVKTQQGINNHKFHKK